MTPAGIMLALTMLSKAYKTELPLVEKECGPSVKQAVSEVEAALGNFESPQEVLIQLGKNIQINKIDIEAEFKAFMADIKSSDYKNGGINIGKALHQITIGKGKENQNIYV